MSNENDSHNSLRFSNLIDFKQLWNHGSGREKVDSQFAQIYRFRGFSIGFSVLPFSQGAHQGRQSSPITMPQRL
jgi:hypothetical protein